MNTQKYDETTLAIPTTEIFLQLFLEIEAKKQLAKYRNHLNQERDINDASRTTFTRTLLVTAPCKFP